MGKKNRQGRKGQQVPEKSTIAVKENRKINQPAKKPMLNFLLILVAILPFMFSWEIMDANLIVRYGMLSGFALLFVLYFYGFRKKLVTADWPLIIRLVFIAGIAYGVWNMCSLFFAVNQQQVYYGVGRHFLNMLFLFIITQIASTDESYLLQLCKLLSIAAIIHSIIGVCQFYDLAFNDLPGNYKPYGLMGNRNVFGSAQVLLLPFTIFVLYKGNKFWKYLATVALTGIVISAILSQTRSSWLAGVGSLVVALILVGLFSPVNRKKWIIGTIAGFAIISALAFLLVASDKGGEFSLSMKQRSTNIFTTSDSTDKSGATDNVKERLKIWAKTTELIKDNLLTGVGPGNWKLVVAKYGSEGLVWAKGNYIPDSTHNEYLMVLAESGIPGLIMYLGMWIMIAVIAFKTIVKPLSEERRILNILMLSGLAGFAVDSMFSFPTDRIEHTLYVYLMAGIIIGSFINSRDSSAKKQQLKKWQLVLFLLVAAFNLFLSQKKYSFEKHLLLSKSYEASGGYQQSIDEGNKAINAFASIPPNGFPVQTYMGLAYKGLKNYPAAIKEMDAAIKLHPYNKALYINKGTIYTSLGQYDTAIVYYKKALKLTPEFDIIYFNLAINYFQLKDYKSCLDYLNKTNIGTNKQLLDVKQQAEYQLALQNQSKEITVEQK